jgi:Protein of unknown function (DUF1579)
MTSSFSHRMPRLVLLTVACIALAADRAGAQGPPMPQPSPQHEILMHGVGVWDATTKVWPTPDAQPVTGQGKEIDKMLEGGMWLMSRYESDFGGMKYVGEGAFGYDPIEKKYVGGWIDSMSPYMAISKGDYDAATKTMTMITETRDPSTGKPVTQKQVSRMIDHNTRTFEIQQKGDDGKYWKMLEIQYKRQAD